jgi:hypothetical protein
MNVLKGYVFRGKKGDALRAWLQLYPGDINKHVAAISAAMKAKGEKAADLTLGECVVWHGLFIAGSASTQTLPSSCRAAASTRSNPACSPPAATPP